MTCKNCFRTGIPGQTIKYKGEYPNIYCIVCGDFIIKNKKESKMDYDKMNWERYFHSICLTVSSKSPCLSRHIGAVLARDHSILSTGYNGPPRGVPHCEGECPRKTLGYKSGTHLELCPAQHAETNAIANAARLGVSVLGSTLYMNCIIPCKNCFGSLINAGIVEIVVDDIKVYDKYTQYLIDNSTIKIRRFEL